jgi:hypothetical protein
VGEREKNSERDNGGKRDREEQTIGEIKNSRSLNFVHSFHAKSTVRILGWVLKSV